MGWIKVVTAFMASSKGTPEEIALVDAVVKGLAERKKTGIYGGCDIGLMGDFVRSARRHGFHVKGYIPTELLNLVKKHNGDYKPLAHIEEEVANMDIRKARMIKECDVAITFPGGSGSFEEFWTFQVFQELSSYNDPDAPVSSMFLVNQNGYYDGTVQQIETIVTAKKKHAEAYKTLYVVNSAEELLKKLDELDSHPRMKGRDLLPSSYSFY